MSRLRWKLLTAMIAVIAVTIVASGLVTRRVTHDQVRKLLIAHEPAVFGDAVRAFEEQYRAN